MGEKTDAVSPGKGAGPACRRVMACHARGDGGGVRRSLLSRNFLLDWRFGDNLRISPLKHKREWSFPLKTKGLSCKLRSRSLQMNANLAQGYGYLCNVIIGAVVSRK